MTWKIIIADRGTFMHNVIDTLFLRAANASAALKKAEAHAKKQQWSNWYVHSIERMNDVTFIG